MLPLSLWGKRSKDNSSTHLLEYHLVDVASVCGSILENDSNLLDQISTSFGIDDKSALDMMRFLASIHDIGKASDVFQRRESGDRMVTYRHDIMGYVVLTNLFLDDMRMLLMGPDSKNGRGIRMFVRDLIRTSTMHHGSPAGCTEHDADVNDMFSNEEIERVRTILGHMAQLYAPVSGTPGDLLEAGTYRHVTSLMAGIISLSDWIASDESLFSHNGVGGDLYSYAKMSATIAKKIVSEDELGVFGIDLPEKSTEFFELFGFEPSPLQEMSCNAIAPEVPLIIIEDTTGSGKTEASLVWTLRQLSKGKWKGLTYALPTKATSNLMFRRLRGYNTRLLGGDSSLSLIHGSSRTYLESEGASDISGWYTESNNKALFANLAVCTVDQVLLSLLPVRYEPLKLLSLARHVLVIDEVHSFDAFTFRLIRGMVATCKLYGIPVILLSATLPSGMRKALVESYGCTLDSPSMSYPLMTICGEGRCTEIPCICSERSRRDVRVRYTSDADEIYGEMVGLVEGGFKVCYIRNTVDDAIASYDRLRSVTDCIVILIHSRFTVRDRTSIENAIFDLCDKNSGKGEGLILVGTQVVEQSMDISFDRLYVDLAPMDAVIQRMGRLQRFGSSELECELVINGPEITDSPTERWYSDYLESASHVYQNHHSLWMTAKELAGRIIHVPADFRELIESAYSEPPEGSPFLANYQKFMDTSIGKAASSANQMLNLEQCYGFGSMFDGRSRDEDDSLSTRDDDGRTETCILLVRQAGSPKPISGDCESSLIRVRRGVECKTAECHLGGKWEYTKKILMEPFREEGGTVTYKSGRLRYNGRRGLEYVQSD